MLFKFCFSCCYICACLSNKWINTSKILIHPINWFNNKRSYKKDTAYCSDLFRLLKISFINIPP